jgi:hypothetical protein
MHAGSLYFPHAWLVKLDAEGNTQWNKTFTGLSPERGEGIKAICQTNEGYLLAGIMEACMQFFSRCKVVFIVPEVVICLRSLWTTAFENARGGFSVTFIS